MSKTITAVFKTRLAADAALVKLDQAGFTKDQVTMLVTEETRGKHFSIDEDSKAGEGALDGAAIGEADIAALVVHLLGPANCAVDAEGPDISGRQWFHGQISISDEDHLSSGFFGVEADEVA